MACQQLNSPPQAAHGGGVGLGGDACTLGLPEDSNIAVGIHDHATQKASECMTERQTN